MLYLSHLKYKSYEEALLFSSLLFLMLFPPTSAGAQDNCYLGHDPFDGMANNDLQWWDMPSFQWYNDDHPLNGEPLDNPFYHDDNPNTSEFEPDYRFPHHRSIS